MSRQIDCQKVIEAVASLCQQANIELSPDIQQALEAARKAEPSPAGQAILEELIENAALARQQRWRSARTRAWRLSLSGSDRMCRLLAAL